ncbi:MAG: hypothetical protein VX737_03860 [Pseudomonadota bacterium]|nr:hypothetical protein [Pseudomonadota bacterium]
MVYNTLAIQIMNSFMSVYTQEIITKIRTTVEGLSDQDQNKFSDQLIFLDQLETLIQQQSTLKEAAEPSPSSENQPTISQRIQELEKKIDENIAMPLYEKLTTKPEGQQMVARPSEFSTMYPLYLFNLLGAIPLFGIFFRALVKLQEKNTQSQQISDGPETPQPPVTPRLDKELQQFLSFRSKFLSRELLKQSIVTKLQDSHEKLSGKAPDMIRRIKALKHTATFKSILSQYYLLELDLDKTSSPLEKKDIIKFENSITRAETEQRAYISDQVLKNSDPAIQQQLSDISHYEDTLKHLTSSYDINEREAVHFIDQDENVFLQSVLTEHTKRRQQLALDMRKYSDQCKKFFPAIANLETALAFADPSAQMRFVNIMKNSSDNDLEKDLSDYVKSFDSDFLKTATLELTELEKTPGFRAAFDQASLTDKRQLILDYQLPNSLKQRCHNLLTVQTYSNFYGFPLSQEQRSKIDKCFKAVIKKDKLNPDTITKEFESVLPHLSLKELKELQELLFSQNITDDYKLKVPINLCYEYFINNNILDSDSLVRANDKIDLIMKQKYFIEQQALTDKVTEPQKPLSQEIAEQFIEDQKISSESTEPMKLTAASSSTARTIALQELQKNAKQSTQQTPDLPKLGREIDPPHPESGPSQQP